MEGRFEGSGKGMERRLGGRIEGRRERRAGGLKEGRKERRREGKKEG